MHNLLLNELKTVLLCLIKHVACTLTCGRRGGLMVSALDSGSGGPGALCSWARHLTLTVPLSSQVYKWVPANLRLGVTPIQGRVEILHATA